MDRESTIYGAIIAECERIEGGQRAAVNGHHLAQKLAAMAVKALAEWEPDPAPAQVEGVLEFVCGGGAELEGDGWDAKLDEQHVAEWMRDQQRVIVEIRPLPATAKEDGQSPAKV